MSLRTRRYERQKRRALHALRTIYPLSAPTLDLLVSLASSPERNFPYPRGKEGFLADLPGILDAASQESE